MLDVLRPFQIPILSAVRRDAFMRQRQWSGIGLEHAGCVQNK